MNESAPATDAPAAQGTARLPDWIRSTSVIVPASLVLALVLLATLALVVRGEVEQSEASARDKASGFATSPAVDRMAGGRLDPR